MKIINIISLQSCKSKIEKLLIETIHKYVLSDSSIEIVQNHSLGNPAPYPSCTGIGVHVILNVGTDMSADESNVSSGISDPSDSEEFAFSAHEDSSSSEDTDRDPTPIDRMHTMFIRRLNRRIANSNDDSTDSDSSETPDDNAAVITNLDPDEETRSLPCQHTYLGELCQVRGRTIMDDGSIQKIPLLFPATQITLVPGQSFPLMETEENNMKILDYSIQNDHIFGIVSSTYWNRMSGYIIGTTAEIIAYSQTDDSLKVKAIGRQRFQVISMATQRVNDTSINFATIRILPEICLKPFLEDVRLPSLNKIRITQKYKCFRREASFTRWPSWVLRNYDEKHLIQEIKQKLENTFLLQRNIVYSDDASTLSFQLLKNIPISDSLILEAMNLNSPIQRLRWFLDIMNSQTGKLKCATCQVTIGSAPDIFAMSAEGAHGTYVNSLGYVHELITLRKVHNVAFTSEMDENYSWFPGYAWSVLTCKTCRFHLGWKFTAQKADLVPNEFWGIRNSSIKIKYQKPTNENERMRTQSRNLLHRHSRTRESVH